MLSRAHSRGPARSGRGGSSGSVWRRLLHVWVEEGVCVCVRVAFVCASDILNTHKFAGCCLMDGVRAYLCVCVFAERTPIQCA